MGSEYDYVVVESRSLKTLQDNVTELGKLGYRPVGSFIVSPETQTHYLTFFQAMHKCDETGVTVQTPTAPRTAWDKEIPKVGKSLKDV